MGQLVAWITKTLQGPDAYTLVEALALLPAVVFAFWRPSLGSRFYRKGEEMLRRWAASNRRALWSASLLPVGVRLLTLPIYPPPEPRIHDEFSFLLIADTLLEGRLANPTHPLWVHFESMHVFFQPSYASKYPVGQGVILALPRLVGLREYWGVWLSCGLMTAATYWMLRGWLSPHWSLLASAVIFFRVSVMSSWMHTYWGGAVAATGGALALGGFRRLTGRPCTRHALVLGAGLAILANSRPYEGGVVGLLLALALLIWLIRSPFPRRLKIRQVVLPLTMVLLATAAFIGWHNWRVTGDFLKLPYMRNRELYATPQSFYWQPPVPPVPFRHKEIADNYKWQFSMWQAGQQWNTLLEATWKKLKEAWTFFLGPLWLCALIFLPAAKREGLAVPILAVLLVLIAVGCYPFYYNHYLAPAAASLLLLIAGSLQALRRLDIGKRPVGLALSRHLVLIAMLSVAGQIAIDIYRADEGRQYKTPRTQVVEELTRMGGRHLIFVRYTPWHDFHQEVVYNRADIDAAPIVWARDMGRFYNEELIRYYPDRKVWVFEPDFRPPRIFPYGKEFPLQIPKL